VGKGLLQLAGAGLGTLAALSFLIAGLAVDSQPPTVERITASDLKSDVYFLASDEMGGRDTASVHNQIASRYLAHRFERLSLKPAGEDGSYFQNFDLVQSDLAEPNRFEILRQGSSNPTVGQLRDDFYPSPLSANGKVLAGVVFAGYGISAPELQYDDYAGIDVRHKIVLILEHEPGELEPKSPFDGLVSSDYGRPRYKLLNAQRHGAVAVILVEDLENHDSDEKFSRRMRSVWPKDKSKAPLYLKVWTDSIEIPAVHISQEMADYFFEKTPITLGALQRQIDNEYRAKSFRLPKVQAHLETKLTRKEKRSRNVLASLPGSDSELGKQLVIIGAHLDHVGGNDGTIYNGADDDASGIAGLLEIAEAFSASPQGPKRSILFAAWNAEERGLLGSYYYTGLPSFPLDQTKLMLQMDMIGRNEEVPDSDNHRFRGLEEQSAAENRNSLNVLGYSRSADVRRLVEDSNRGIGLTLRFRYDNHSLDLLRRSDHWPFLNRGIPVAFFHTGLHPDYHRSTDTADKINYGKMEKIVRLVFVSAWTAANAAQPPALSHARKESQVARPNVARPLAGSRQLRN
jgi:hypothetical protein